MYECACSARTAILKRIDSPVLLGSFEDDCEVHEIHGVGLSCGRELKSKRARLQ